MLALALPPGPLRILCLGAHPDDMEIGCGGSVLRLLAEHPGSSCWWVVLSGGGTGRESEAQDGAARFLAKAAERRVAVHQFRDGHFPVALSGIKDALEEVQRGFSPDLIFTHYRDDRHQDHRTVSDVTWQTFRDHLVLEYEVPKWDGDLGVPNCYVALSEAVRRQKVEHLLTAFPSQRDKRWFSAETFLALMRLRGVECGVSEGYAEAFQARKVVVATG
jgi:LmbE family N-acetylglucosaminyl deacetylase